METEHPSKTCSSCSFRNTSDAKFCQNCGEPLALTCNSCGTDNLPEAHFCKNCGQRLERPPSPDQEKKLRSLRQAAPGGLQEKMRAAGSEIEGERKPVTILFADIVGSTAIAEKLDPEEWKEIVSGAHRRVSEAIYRYEGTIAQLLGDGVLAFFGAPITHEDDPIRAVRAALDIQESIGQYCQELAGVIEDFQMRVGINTGTVVVGEIGDDMHMEYLAIGDAVNVAARLQSAAKPGKVLLSEACARLVGEAFGLKTLGDIQVKGKAEALAAYEVVEARAPTVVRRGIERFQAPYIGRGREVEQLQSVLLALCEGHGQIVALVGEAGIGKTRLLEEVKALVCQGESDAESTPISPKTIRWLEGRSVSYGGSLSYWAITQLLLEDLGLSEGAPQVKIKVALRRRVKDLFGEEKSDDLLPYLSHLLGLTQEGEAEELIQSLDGESLKRGTLTSVQDYFASVAKERPTVLVFEDMHWADSSSLEALESLLAPTDLVPLMILMLMRIERDHGSWGVKIKAETDFPHRYTDVHLGRLSDADSSELMVHLLGADELLEELRSMIMARSEGNPFYLEEVTRHLVEEGLIVRDEEGWRATEAIGEIGIPETLHGVLLARIDRLEEDVRRTLQMASVVGKSFLYRILEAISEVERQLDEHLSQLQRVDLVREKARIPELEYMFKHTLTQEAAYNSLLHARRKEFHWKVGEALEKLFADREEDFLGILAHHFEAAEVHDKAVDYLIRAGDRARLAYAHQEAIDSYQRALSLLEAQEEYERMARTLMKLGLTYHNSFDFHRASKAYEEGFAMWKQAAETQPVISVPPAPHALRLGWIEPRTLDPTMAFETASIPVTAQLFSGLVQLSPDLEILPDVAHSWEVLDAGRRYVFHLREDVCWSDGEPVTAKDFEFGWKHVLNPATESPCAYLLYDVKGAREFHEGRISYADYAGVRAIDDVTLCAELEEPTSYFMQLLSLPPFYPLPRHVVEVYGKMWSDVGTIVTNGPFMVVEWKPGESIVLARNPAYHGRCMGNVQEVRLIPKRGWSAELGMYEADDLDSLDIRRYPWKELERIRQRYAGEYVIFPAHSTFYLGFNVKQSPFHDVCVRQAFVMALDREMLASMLAMDHFSPITGGFVPPGMPGYSAGITLPYDPDRARQLLAGSGYPGGRGFPKVELLLIPHYRASEIGEFLQMQWREYLAVEILWEVQEWGKFMERLQDKPPNMYYLGWGANYPDPDSFLRGWYAQQGRQSRWRNESYEGLVERARRVTDQAERMKLYAQADRIIMEEVPIFPLAHSRQLLLLKPWVKRYPTAATGYHFLKDVILEPH